MRRNFTLLLTILFASMSVGFAQKTTLGVRAGVNFSGVYEGFGAKHFRSNLKTGLNVGFNAEVPVATRFYLQPGLLFSTKGYSVKAWKTVAKLCYIELPVNLIFKSNWGSGKLLLGAGPYLATAVGGSFRSEDSDGESDFEFEEDITWDQALTYTEYRKRLDGGVNFLVGYEFVSKLSLQLNGQLGLLNISPTIEGESFYNSDKNIGFSLSVGYRF
ncbi:MAG: outer membrane beta-barrel protein [Chitinophagaceae bacterium]